MKILNLAPKIKFNDIYSFVSNKNSFTSAISDESNALKERNLPHLTKNHIIYFCGNKDKQQELASQVSIDNLREHVTFLASKKCAGRLNSTQGIENSRKYIEERFNEYGLKPFKKISKDFRMNSFYQKVYRECAQKGNKTKPVDNPIEEVHGGLKVANIIGYIPGKKSDEYIFVMAHHDHFGRDHDTGAIYSGAEDNASGVASMLEIARILSKSKPKKNIVFVATEGEEIGCLGASVLAKKLKALNLQDKVKFINIDSVGAKGNNLMIEGEKGSEGNKELTKKLFSKADALEISYVNSPKNYYTDAAKMETFGFPAVSLLWDWKKDESNRPYNHKVTDKPNVIQYRNVKKATQVALSAIEDFSGIS
jgi:hypothetical protein